MRHFAVMVKRRITGRCKRNCDHRFHLRFGCLFSCFLQFMCHHCSPKTFTSPLRPGKSEATYVMVGRIATVVVVILGMAWIPVMMSLGSLYDYLQGIQSLLAPAMVAVFFLGIFSKKITPKAGEWGMIVGFLIGMVRLATNVMTNTGKDVMTGAFWENTTWFWQTNWLVFEVWLLVFLIVFMFIVSCFTPKTDGKTNRSHYVYNRL